MTQPTSDHATTTTTHDASLATLATYDALLARDVARRDATHDATQRERDARRAAYDASLDHAPITRILRDMRRPTSRTSQSGWAPRPPRAHKDTLMPTGPNAWEAKGPHMAAHKATDKACHHPLVVCHHKW